MNTIESIDLIYRNPEVRGGKPCIVGTGLRVIDIVMAMIFAERTPDQLAQDYDHFDGGGACGFGILLLQQSRN